MPETFDHPTLDTARRIADIVRPVLPDIAAGIDAMIDKAKAEGASTIPVKVTISFTLEKFDGDRQPGQVPVATISGEG